MSQPFKMPETLDGLSLEQISELHAAARAEAVELNKIPDDKITTEQSRRLVELFANFTEIGERKTVLEGEAAAAAEELAAARAGFVEEPAEEIIGEAVVEVAEPAEVVVVEEPALVAAGVSPAAKVNTSFAAKVGKKLDEAAPDGGADEDDKAKALSITASANVPGINVGTELDLDGLAAAFIARGRAFAGGSARGKKGPKALEVGRHDLSAAAQRFGVATLNKPTNPFTINEKDSDEVTFDLIKRATSENTLAGGSLVAAGGWCAPSERIWDFLELEDTDAMLSIPEITARRGGIMYTKGPQLGTLLVDATLGFTQTEAQADAGTTKPCFVIACPAWEEVRLDAIGFCIKAGILTNAAYPELIRRYLGLGLIVHARRLNAATINRISTAIGAATTFANVTGTEGVGATTSDVLSALELQVLRIRQMYSMSPNKTVEGVGPLWAKAVIRADLSRRTGVDLLSVTDAQINAWFTQRGVSMQFVYDYQNLNNGAATTVGGTGGWTRYPDKVEFMLYPAGSFVRLGTDVIDLDTVYDTDGLTVNQYTAAFFEEGFAVANTGGTGVKVVINLPNLYGATGVAGVGADATQVTL